MGYATVTDMINRFGAQELVQLTDPDLQAVNAETVGRALDDAQALADGYVGRIYGLPIAGCVKPAPTEENPAATQLVPPPQLTRICCDVARYYLHTDLAPEHEVYLRYKASERELQAIADSKAVLACPWGGAPGTLLAGSAPGDAEAYHSFSPRQITDDTLRGFA